MERFLRGFDLAVLFLGLTPMPQDVLLLLLPDFPAGLSVSPRLWTCPYHLLCSSAETGMSGVAFPSLIGNSETLWREAPRHRMVRLVLAASATQGQLAGDPTFLTHLLWRGASRISGLICRHWLWRTSSKYKL